MGVLTRPHSRISSEPVSSPAPFSTAVPGADGLLHERLDRRGHDRRHAGARDAASFGRLGLVPPDGDVADRDAGHVRDRVGRSGLELTDPQAELPQARAARSGRAVGHGRTVRSPREARHARRLERRLPAPRSGRRDLGRRADSRDRDRGEDRGDQGGSRSRRARVSWRRRRTRTRRCSRFTIRGSWSTCDRPGASGTRRACPRIPARIASSRTCSRTGASPRSCGSPRPCGRSPASTPTTR